jgi:sulfite reductase alpha subunit-like flavoprotein
MHPLPYIPDNAPFTPEQRGWLNGLLAGLFSAAPATPAPATASLKIAVLYASQSGTAEGLARKVTKELKANGYIASLISLEGYTPAALASAMLSGTTATKKRYRAETTPASAAGKAKTGRPASERRMARPMNAKETRKVPRRGWVFRSDVAARRS